ncbi:MAG: hypothetical protein AAGH74_02525 [Pseudomonadota bacterium]
MRSWIIGGLSLFAAGAAEACVDTVPAELIPELERAIELRDDGARKAAEPLFARLEAQAPENFCILYEYGRLLVQEEDYKEGLALLDRALDEPEASELRSRPAYNMRGFIHLKLKDFDSAAEDFERQKEWVDRLPEDIRASTELKVFNNTGWAYLQQDRYDQAELNFTQAEKLGSKLATRNLEVTRSIVDTIEKQDKDTGGVFAAIAKSSRAPRDIERAADELVKQGIPPEEIKVFRRVNGMLSLTYGSYLSYPKAQDFKDKITPIFSDSNVASVGAWEDVTSTFFGDITSPKLGGEKLTD